MLALWERRGIWRKNSLVSGVDTDSIFNGHCKHIREAHGHHEAL